MQAMKTIDIRSGLATGTTHKNNDFFLASQFWISGDYGRRHEPTSLALSTALPAVFLELKAMHKCWENAFRLKSDPTTPKTVPTNLWHKRCDHSLDGQRPISAQPHNGWRRSIFAEWKKINDERRRRPSTTEFRQDDPRCRRASRLLDLVRRTHSLHEAEAPTPKLIARRTINTLRA